MNNDVQAVVAYRGNYRDNSWLMYLKEKEANTMCGIFYGSHIRISRIVMKLKYVYLVL